MVRGAFLTSLIEGNFHNRIYVFTHTLKIVVDLTISKTDHFQIITFKYLGTKFIMFFSFRSIML